MKNITDLFKIDNVTNISGLTEELNVLYINNYFNVKKKNIIH